MSDTQVYYIHGFRSTAESETLQLLRKEFPDAIGLDYDHNDPSGSILAMVIRINSDGKFPTIVGSSLGGWYTEQLTKRIVGDFIMYNPSTQPEVALARYGLSQEVLYKYKTQSSSSNRYSPMSSRTVVLCSDDEVVDPTLADVKYRGNAAMLYTNGGHRMTIDNMKIITDRIKYLENQLP